MSMQTSDYQVRALFVDAGSGESSLRELPPGLSAAFLGGRGMGVLLLNRDPSLDPLDAGAPLVFSTGALTGSRIPSSGRMAVCGFSPLTNTVCSSSVGGRLAVSMKRAGVDLLCITGRADRPAVLVIEDGRARFENLELGLDAPLSRVFAALKPAGGSAAAVGPAAFSGCRYACIMVDGSFTSGRGGLGAVMASKNVRAVAVRGSGAIRTLDARAEEEARRDIVRLFDASPAIMGGSGLKNFGTAALVDLVASRRMMPTANFRRTYFEDYRAFCAGRIREHLRPRHYACPGCPVACKQTAGTEIPEYETLSHFGALNENTDLEAIIEANRLCNEAGMDTITAASSIACLSEIRQEPCTGRRLVEAVKSIAESSGDGELLKLGSAELARALGAPEKSMSVKSLELPAYDPRGAYGMALAYCTSTRGGCHLQAYPISHEILRKPVATDRFSFSGKARIIKIAEDANAVIDSIGACKFAFFGATLEEYAKGFRAVTGLTLDAQDLLAAGDTIFALERHLNCLRGFGRRDDLLPARFFTEPGTPGPGIEVPPVDRDAFEETLDRYYRIRGCTPEGVLTRERREEVGACANR
jgi:aldehyde:ferredoxin oxidoreductase